jgi:hypothetical protein
MARLLTACLSALAAPAEVVGGKAWFFRPYRSVLSSSSSSSSSHHAAGAAAAAPGGASYATAWTTTFDIDWSKISGGDTLFVCGLHDSGRVDGALNITGTRGSGVESAPVTIDGRCVDESGVADPGTLMAGKLVSHSELGHPNAHGIFKYSYDSPAVKQQHAPRHTRLQSALLGAGSASGMANKPDILERSGHSTTGPHVVRLKHGACNAKSMRTVGSPVNPGDWAPGTACYTGMWTNRTTIYYKPSAGVTTATLYVFEYNRPSSRTAAVNGWAPVNLHYAHHVIIRNLTLQGPAWEIVKAVGGHHITVMGNVIRWASFTGVSVGDVPFQDNRWNYSQGSTGTDYLTVKHNLITQTATGVYTISMHTWQNSNHLYVGYNHFIDIDTENNYGNGDTHAIGIQGGSWNLFEHNLIDGAGGSGITMYQGPDNQDGQPPQEMHDNVIRYNVVKNVYTTRSNSSISGASNQRGIEICDSHYVGPSTSYNNSVYYNVIANVTGDGLRSKAHAPGAGHGEYQWRWLNNVVPSSSDT